MSKSSVLAILAAVGIVYLGPVGSDAQALARAIQGGDPASLEQFILEHSASALRADAIILLADNERACQDEDNILWSRQGCGGSGGGSQVSGSGYGSK